MVAPRRRMLVQSMTRPKKPLSRAATATSHGSADVRACDSWGRVGQRWDAKVRFAVVKYVGIAASWLQ